MSAEMIQMMLEVRNQVKIYHWQTHKYPRHIATDGLTAKLDELIDTFVETYMGKYGRPKFTAKTSVLHLDNFNEKKGAEIIDMAVDYLIHKLPKKLDARKDTDLLNLKDEILGELNQIKYLFTLS
jgi:hypothetical protein